MKIYDLLSLKIIISYLSSTLYTKCIIVVGGYVFNLNCCYMNSCMERGVLKGIYPHPVHKTESSLLGLEMILKILYQCRVSREFLRCDLVVFQRIKPILLVHYQLT